MKWNEGALWYEKINKRHYSRVTQYSFPQNIIEAKADPRKRRLNPPLVVNMSNLEWMG